MPEQALGGIQLGFGIVVEDKPSELSGMYFLDITAITNYFRKEKGRQDVDNAVLELTEDNFDNIVNSSPLILVEFYAEWCAPCQQLEPHYAAAARRWVGLVTIIV